MTSITTEALITGPSVRVKRTRHGFVLYNLHDAYVGRSIDLYGEFSEEETKIFARIVKPGMTVIDIGANIGAHTLFFAQAVGPTGAVIAFEPQRVLHQMLCANLALNEITNVRPLQMGAGRQSGQAFIPAIDYAKPNNFGGIALGRHGFGEEVMVVPIDQIGLEQCHFMKIDVEGMEEDVILGARETISRHRPILYVENDRREKSPSLIRRLLDLNYVLHWHAPPLYSADNLYGNPQNVFPDIVSLNMLCVPRESGMAVMDGDEIVDPQEWPGDPPGSGTVRPPPLGSGETPSERAPTATAPATAVGTPITAPPAAAGAAAMQGTAPTATAEILRALALEQAGQSDDAEDVYAAILAADPHNVHALHRRAILCAQRGEDVPALALIERAIRADIGGGPGHDQLLADYGLMLHQLKRYEDAAAACSQALALASNLFVALFNHGNAVLKLKRYPEALASFERALVVQPDHTGCIGNRGIALAGLRRFDEAIASFDQALAKEPGALEPLIGCGDALAQLGRYDEAIERLDQVLARSPDNAEAHFGKALFQLALGRLREGFEEYEWRWRIEDAKSDRPVFAQPQWNGDEPLAGKTILLYSEQGMGDTIMFVRYAALLAARGARVVAAVHPLLKAVVSGADGLSRVVAQGDELPPFDLQAPLLSLPRACKTDLDSIPASVPYIHASPQHVTKWRDRLPAIKPLRARLRVGLVWSGSRGFAADASRSIALSRMKPFLTDERIELVSLVREVREEDVELLRNCSNILDVGQELSDFADTAAIVSLLDLVISVDTAVAHLAGAMARPVWILLPFAADFRWMVGREDSPWYPTARLFRQPGLGDWDGALARLRDELARFPVA